MRLLLLAIFLFVWIRISVAQRLPDGPVHFSRERSIDITHLRLTLALDIEGQKIAGEACLSLKPLHRISNFDLDAIKLNIKGAYLKSGNQNLELAYTPGQTKLRLYLNREYTPDDSLHICIAYQASPQDGMYFSINPANPDQKYCFTYGEGGLHANWMPIYNENDDKFTSEMIIKVDPPNQVISNGRLIKNTPSGTFHWLQEKPHSNYLVVIYAGNFETGPVADNNIKPPQSYWVPPDNSRLAEYTFRNTPDMNTFFSGITGFEYPWEKYDQVVIPGYAIGGMEHTSVTGLRYATLRDSSAPESSSPEFDSYHQVWTSESLVSHELAHMWFGDLLTCKDLRYIWLNESFATYMQFLWDRQYYGDTYFDFDRLSALDQYLSYVCKTHLIRSLEYDRFNVPDDMYNNEHTYLKGALVLHMLHTFLGDEDFKRVLDVYVDTYSFKNVVSRDLEQIIGQATGKDFSWFFADWIYGGGHPVLEVSYDYLADINQVFLKVKQVQSMVEGQDLFRLPAKITIVTSTERFEYPITISGEYEEILIPCPDFPLMVSVDGAGDLVADIREEKSLQDWIYQCLHDSTAGRIRAARSLVTRYPNEYQTYEVIREMLTIENSWHIRAEAASLSGLLAFPSKNSIVETASNDPDYRVRKALVIGLSQGPADIASEKLQQILSKEKHRDVQATVLISLSKIDPDVCVGLLPEYIDKISWYDELKISFHAVPEKYCESCNDRNDQALHRGSI